MSVILIVENEKKWRRLLVEGLEAKGYFVHGVSSWQEANERLQGPMYYDVVILNLHLMVKADYLAQKVLDAVVRYCPKTPCIILSGYPNELIKKVGRYREQVFELIWKGGDPRGFDLHLLYTTVERAIRERTVRVAVELEVLSDSIQVFAAQQDRFISDISRVLYVSVENDVEQIKMLETRLGSVLVTLEMSERAAQRLLAMYLTGAPILSGLGITRVEFRRDQSPPGTLSEPSRITWLHLSDFHFKADNPWDSQIVFEHLLEDIANRTAIDPALEQIDFVFVTGDLSYSGQREEYEIALSFLKQLKRVTGARKDRIFIVPGNHDVERSAIPANAFRASLKDRTSIGEMWRDLGLKTAFLKRFDNYRRFVNSEYRHIRLGEDEFCYVKRRTVGGKPIGIMGLNSAWTSAENDEYGKLMLGDLQVREALKQMRRRDVYLSISLLHHPLDWLMNFDRSDCEPQLHRGCDFLLHGHMHRTGVLTLTAPGRQAMVFGAGACYMGRDRPNSYNCVCLDLENQRGVVYFREYTDRDGGHWTNDTRTYREAPDGKYEFPLPVGL